MTNAALPKTSSLSFEPIKYAPDYGIPNWTTQAPHTAGTLAPGPRGSVSAPVPVPFVLSAKTRGAQYGYGSVADAIAAASKLSTGGNKVPLAVVQKGTAWFTHEVWTYTQRQGEPNTRLAGATITSFKPLHDTGLLASFATPFAGLQAIVDGTVVLMPATYAA